MISPRAGSARCGRTWRRSRRSMLGADRLARLARRHDQQPLDDVAQLAHIARASRRPCSTASASSPIVRGRQALGLGQARQHEMAGQDRDVLAALAAATARGSARRSGGRYRSSRKRPSGISCCRSRLVEAMTRTSTSTPCPCRRRAERSAPAGRARSCPGSPAACRRPRRAAACRHGPARRCRSSRGPSGRSRLAAEQLDLEPLGPHGRAVEDDEGPVGALASAGGSGAPRLPCRRRPDR